jgi:hypothetical protein
MRGLVVAISSATLLAGVLGGCGGVPSYSGSKACGVPVERISAVLGTDHFHTVTRGGTLPPRTGVTFRCSVDLEDRDDMVTVTAERTSSEIMTQQQQTIAAADERFTVAGAAAGIDVASHSFSGRWTCPERSPDGTMRVYVTAGEKATAAQRKALLRDVAQRASTACTP